MFSDIHPSLFALTSALLFAVGAQIQNVGLSRIDSRNGATISIVASAVLLWLMAPFLMDWSNWSKPAVLIFILVGLFRPSVSANLAVAGMRYLGPTLTTTLSSTSPLFGAFFGVLLLGETVTWPIAIGTGGIIAAIAMLARRDAKVPTTWPLWALGLPIGAAAIRSIGHVLSKIGMESIPDAYFAAMVSFTVSAVIMLVLHRVKPGVQRIPWRTPGPYWFVAAAVVMSVTVLSLNTALMHGQIVTVVPIVASSPVFTMLLSILVFRRERLTPRIVLAVALVVPSVIFIALSL